MLLRRFVLLLAIAGAAVPLSAQTPGAAELPPALTRMIETERAFAARALVVGWKQAFLEYFDDVANLYILVILDLDTAF